MTPSRPDRRDRAATGENQDEPGHWPSWWRRLWEQDLRRGKKVKSGDGVVAPRLSPPSWLNLTIANNEEFKETTRELYDAAEARVRGAETRAASVFDAAWKLLAIALVTAGFIATRIRSSHIATSSAPARLWWLLMVPSVLAIIAFGLAAFIGLTTSHRVALGWEITAEDVALARPDERTAAQAIDHYNGAAIVDWTAQRKLDEFLLAQAWLSRGVVALIVAGLVLSGLWVATTDNASAPTRRPPQHSSASASAQ